VPVEYHNSQKARKFFILSRFTCFFDKKEFSDRPVSYLNFSRFGGFQCEPWNTPTLADPDSQKTTKSNNFPLDFFAPGQKNHIQALELQNQLLIFRASAN